MGEDHPDPLTAMNNLALAYKAAGQVDRAILLLEQVLPARRAKLGEGHPHTLSTQMNLVLCYEQARRFQDAELLLRETVGSAGRSRPRNDRIYSDSLALLGRCLIRERKSAEALPILRQCLAMKEKAQPDDQTTANTR